MSRKGSSFFIGLLVVLLAACSSPLFEIRDNPIEAGTDAPVSMNQVGDAIMEAGKGLGWKMASTKNGEVTGTYSNAKQSATVAIPYTTKTYSILYKNSSNFKYNGTKIHKRYNELVSGLDAAIRRELSRVTNVSQPVKQEEPTTMRSLTNWLKNIGSDDSEKEKPATTK
jgi:hypothetical protein